MKKNILQIVVVSIFCFIVIFSNQKRTEYRLSIPSLSIDTVIESVGLTSSGAVGAPEDPLPVGWFDQSAQLGQIGTAVIVGHSGWKDDIPAIFDNLVSIKKGDNIYIADNKGVVSTFVVREIKSYRSDENVSDIFISTDGKSHLNLITCTGVWNDIEKTHADRLVVFSDKVL